MIMMKIGVYVCECGINIAATVDVEKVAETAKDLPNVTVSRYYKYMCSDPGQALIKSDIENHKLDRIVVASCSPRMHEPTFRAVLEEKDMNPYCLEMVNIREQNAWVHKDREMGTEKAILLVRSGVLKASLLHPLQKKKVGVTPTAMVIGAGIAGIQTALDIGNMGYKTYLVEKSPSIGGRMAQLDKTFPTLDCSACILTPKMVDVARHPNIELLTFSEVTKVEGYVGNFNVQVTKKARSVDESLCTGCGDCWENCPIQYTAYTDPPNIPVNLQDGEKAILDEIIGKYIGQRGAIMPILEDINDEFKYLPEESMKYVSLEIGYPLSTVYRIATFYNVFSLKPRGRHIINICMGTTCHVRGAPRILERIKTELRIDVGETTEDNRFTLEPVRCLGCCSLAPVITIDGEAFGNMKPNKIARVIDKYD